MNEKLVSLKKTVEEGVSTLWDIARRRYPDFVYGTDFPATEIPVFLFHTDDPPALDAKFRYLKENRYRTLSIDEYYEIVTGKVDPPGNAVLITVDDGEIGLWSTLFPIMRKYEMKVVAFVIPGLIDGRETMIDWEQATAMHQSGLVALQSHTLNHGLIPISPRLSGFISPYLIGRYHSYELTQHGQIRLGFPLYESDSRMSRHPKCLIDRRTVDACAEFVESRGGADFLNDRGWRRQLRKFHRRQARSSTSPTRYESRAEQTEGMRFEFLESKRIMEERIPGLRVEHISMPWNVTSALAAEVASECGYKTIFVGKVRNKYFTRSLPDPLNIPRVSSDFLCMLPGDGREKVSDIIRRKIGRRSRKGSPYLTH